MDPVWSGFDPVLCQNWTIIVWYFSGKEKKSEFENLKIWNKIKIFTFGVTAGYHGRMVRRKWKRKLERGNTYKTYQSYNIRVTLIWFKRFLFKLNVNLAFLFLRYPLILLFKMEDRYKTCIFECNKPEVLPVSSIMEFMHSYVFI